jgi:general stress protein CsbA
MVSIGDPFAVLNRFAFITYSYYVNMTLTYARFSSASLSREKTSRIIDVALRCKGLLRRELINARARPAGKEVAPPPMADDWLDRGGSEGASAKVARR